jgi:hypothetical protein
MVRPQAPIIMVSAALDVPEQALNLVDAFSPQTHAHSLRRQITIKRFRFLAVLESTLFAVPRFRYPQMQFVGNPGGSHNL